MSIHDANLNKIFACNFQLLTWTSGKPRETDNGPERVALITKARINARIFTRPYVDNQPFSKREIVAKFHEDYGSFQACVVSTNDFGLIFAKFWFKHKNRVFKTILPIAHLQEF